MEIANISKHKNWCVSRDIFRWSRACLEVRGQHFGLVYGIMSEKVTIKGTLNSCHTKVSATAALLMDTSDIPRTMSGHVQ